MTVISVDVPEAATRGQHGVYVVFDGDGEILYIGRTRDLAQRLKSHRTQSAWFKRTRAVEFTPCDGLNQARALEKSLIAEFRPASNTNDRQPIPHARTPLPEWTAAKLVALHEESETREIPRAADPLNNYILALLTPTDAPERAASERLTEMIAAQRFAGVANKRIADQLGVTPLAIKARLARHGYIPQIKGLPQTAYGTPMHRGPGTHCRRDHELTGDNLRVIATTGVRVCRACERIRVGRYQAKRAGRAA